MWKASVVSAPPASGRVDARAAAAGVLGGFDHEQHCALAVDEAVAVG